MKFEVWERWISIIGGVGTASNGTLTTGGRHSAITDRSVRIEPFTAQVPGYSIEYLIEYTSIQLIPEVAIY